jgi:pterin-4a-carbinolamine dehydratase
MSRTVQPLDNPPSVRQRLKAERVQEELQAMPAWRLLEGGKSIDRAFQFPSPQVAAAYSTFVLAFASAAGHAVSLDHNKSQVVVKLAGPRGKGRQLDLTEEILTFARKLG